MTFCATVAIQYRAEKYRDTVSMFSHISIFSFLVFFVIEIHDLLKKNKKSNLKYLNFAQPIRSQTTFSTPRPSSRQTDIYITVIPPAITLGAQGQRRRPPSAARRDKSGPGQQPQHGAGGWRAEGGWGVQGFTVLLNSIKNGSSWRRTGPTACWEDLTHQIELTIHSTASFSDANRPCFKETTPRSTEKLFK